MSKQARRRQHRQPSRGPAATPPTFAPVPVRPRHDGWTPAKQILFIEALIGSACVTEACRRVGMSTNSAYDLRARTDAASFRQAWDLALGAGVERLAEAALGRAIHGVATPIFYKGEQIGERRRYDERLAMLILQRRAPERFGAWIDKREAHRPLADGATLLAQEGLRRLTEDLRADAAGRPRPAHKPIPLFASEKEVEEESTVFEDAIAAAKEEQAGQARWEEHLRQLYPDPDGPPSGGDSDGDVSGGS